MAVANFGLNTKYHASPEKPTLLYYGDFEQDGIYRIVEAEFENEMLFPVRGKSCSTHAMPHLADKFTTYTDFALAGLKDIYEPKCLDDSHRFEANTLESGILINDGVGGFTFTPLPRLAQLAPSFGLAFADADNDGNTDLYVVQNFYGPQPETGRMAGGVRLLLRGTGNGTFRPIAPSKSGLVVSGDAKSLTTADINGDGKLDFVVGVNDDHLVSFETTCSSVPLRILLDGKRGNLTAIGSRITITFSDGSVRAAEVSAGEGYLSQSSAQFSFAVSNEKAIEEIRVTWPDRSTSSTTSPNDSNPLVLHW